MTPARGMVANGTVGIVWVNGTIRVQVPQRVSHDGDQQTISVRGTPASGTVGIMSANDMERV